MTTLGHHTKVLQDRVIKGSPLPNKLIEEDCEGQSVSSTPSKRRPNKMKNDKLFKGKTKAPTRDINGRLKAMTPSFLGANTMRSQHGTENPSWENIGELQDQVDNKFS